MMKPTIHLNGTSREALHEQYLNAWHALREAQRMLDLSHPHGRDYYVQNKEGEGPYGEPFYLAEKEHRARVHALVKVEQELEELALHTMPL